MDDLVLSCGCVVSTDFMFMCDNASGKCEKYAPGVKHEPHLVGVPKCTRSVLCEVHV